MREVLHEVFSTSCSFSSWDCRKSFCSLWSLFGRGEKKRRKKEKRRRKKKLLASSDLASRLSWPGTSPSFPLLLETRRYYHRKSKIFWQNISHDERNTSFHNVHRKAAFLTCCSFAYSSFHPRSNSIHTLNKLTPSQKYNQISPISLRPWILQIQDFRDKWLEPPESLSFLQNPWPVVPLPSSLEA